MPLLSRPVYSDQTEGLCKSFLPLKVIKERPVQISDHRDSVCHTGFHSAKRFSYKLDSSGIIRCPDSVLCDFDFFIPIFAVFSTIFLNVQFEEELLNGGTGLIIHKGSIKKRAKPLSFAPYLYSQVFVYSLLLAVAYTSYTQDLLALVPLLSS